LLVSWNYFANNLLRIVKIPTQRRKILGLPLI
jgi:hypothetical protein